jgi:hypothetical protein
MEIISKETQWLIQVLESQSNDTSLEADKKEEKRKTLKEKIKQFFSSSDDDGSEVTYKV